MLGYQPVRPSGFQMWLSRSWTMKRPTRVPASITVRMKRASNMIAKWYQMERSASPPMVPLKIWAMPTAREGAPPVRFRRVASPTWRARSRMVRGSRGKPQPVMVAAACSAVAPTIPAGLLIAK